MKYQIENMVPCNTNHICIFEDGSKYEVVAWAKKDTKKTIKGDVEKVSVVSGLIAKGDQIIFADEMKGFVGYKNLKSCKEDENERVMVN